MNAYILIKIDVIDEADGSYDVSIDTNLPKESLIKKVLEDTLSTWDERDSDPRFERE